LRDIRRVAGRVIERIEEREKQHEAQALVTRSRSLKERQRASELALER
jgi:hypothetical protein